MPSRQPGKTYTLVSRFLVPDEGWRTVETTLGSLSYEAAGREASRLARELDAKYGDSHFWTVDLYAGDPSTGGHDGLGSYYQLFHGRTN